MKRFLLVLGVATSLAGCSTVRVGYNQLDWLIPVWFQSYVPLTEEQEVRLRQHTDELIAWHCRTQLSRYATWLRQVNADFQAGINHTQLLGHYFALDRAWIELAEAVIPRVADIFAGLSDDQVGELLENMEKSNAEYRKEYMDSSDEKMRRENIKSATDGFSRWFGRLTPEQKAAIERWSHKLKFMRAERWENRLRWQGEFRATLKLRHDREKLTAGLRRLTLEWDQKYSDAYRRQYLANSILVMDLIVEMGRTMTEVQKQYMTRKTSRYAADFGYLVCRPPVDQVAGLLLPGIRVAETLVKYDQPEVGDRQ